MRRIRKKMKRERKTDMKKCSRIAMGLWTGALCIGLAGCGTENPVSTGSHGNDSGNPTMEINASAESDEPADSISGSVAPQHIELLPGIIAAGFSHTAALKKDGTVVATGSNDYGQCEVSNWTDIGQPE